MAAYLGTMKATHPLEAELQPFFKVLLLCKSNRVTIVVFEGDSLILVENLRNEKSLMGPFVMVEETARVTYRASKSWDIRFCRRTENEAVSKLNFPTFTAFHSNLLH